MDALSTSQDALVSPKKEVFEGSFTLAASPDVSEAAQVSQNPSQTLEVPGPSPTSKTPDGLEPTSSRNSPLSKEP